MEIQLQQNLKYSTMGFSCIKVVVYVLHILLLHSSGHRY